MTQQIAITVSEFDDQYDVEVYSWINVLKTKGDLIEDVTEYGFADQEEAIAYIQTLKERYDIVALEQVSEEALETQHEKVMTEGDFWALIDLSLEQKDLETQRNWLIEVLAQMSDDTIQTFDQIMSDIGSDVYYHENRINAYRLAGVNGGDDSMGDFCAWLISRGKEVMEDVLRDPMEVTYYLNEKNLDETGRATNELFRYVASYAFELKHTTQPK